MKKITVIVAGVLAAGAVLACKPSGPNVPWYPGTLSTPQGTALETGTVTEKKGQTPDTFQEVVTFYDGKLTEGWTRKATDEMAEWNNGNMKVVAGDRPRPIDPAQPGGWVQILNAGQVTVIRTAKYMPK